MMLKFKNIIRYIAVILVMVSITPVLQATHVIGGNLQYKCLGNDMYEITVEFAVDCSLGDTLAIGLDSFATVKFFDAQTDQIVESIGMDGEIEIIVQDIIRLGDPNVACRVLDNPVCVQRQRYVQVVELPFNPNGYIISFRRCCRNSSLLSIQTPLNVGATYWTELTPLAQTECNTSARFRNWADVYVCANEDLVFNASAIDEDGDSLVYKLCTPTQGGDMDFSLSTDFYTPPFQDVDWAPGYGLDNLMGAGTPPAIDPVTGILTANAAIQGQFLIGICVEEYRDGVKIGETRRDFEYNVRLCTDPPSADFSVTPNPNCEGLTMEFINGSSSTQDNELTYEWFFDHPVGTIESTDENPVYTFPASGSYNVALVTFDGICQDTAFLQVGVSEENDPDVNFLVSGSGCGTEVDVTLTNQTISSQGVEDIIWTVVTSSGTMTFNGPGPIQFVLDQAQTITVTQDYLTESGCDGTLSQTVDVQGDPLPDLGIFLDNFEADQCMNSPVTLNPGGNPTYTYNWTSSDPAVVFDASSPSPVVTVTQVTTFTANVTNSFGCSTQGVVIVTPVNGPTINIPTDLEQCAGSSIELNPGFNPAYNYFWVSNPPGAIINATDPNPTVTVFVPTTFTVSITDPSNQDCSSETSVNVTIAEGPAVDIINSTVQCVGDSIELNPNFDPNFEYAWTSIPSGALADSTEANPIISVTEFTVFNLTVTDPLNTNCVTETFVNVLVPDTPSISIDPDVTQSILCEGEAQDYTITTDGNNVVWLNGDGDTISTENVLTVQFDSTGMFTAIASNLFGCTNSVEIFVDAAEFIEASFTTNNGSEIYCEDDPVTVFVSADPIDIFNVEWLDEFGNTIGLGDSLMVTPSGNVTYQISAETIEGCPVSGSYTLIQSISDVQIEGPTSVCLFAENELNANVIAGDIVSYDWQPTNSIIGNNDGPSITISPESNTNYVLTTVNADGCEYQTTYSVTVLEVGLITIESDPSELYLGQTSQLSVTPNLPGYSYEWEPAINMDDPTSPMPVFTATETGDIEVTVFVTSPDGCVDSRTIILTVLEAPCSIENFHVPNMFTPNGDNMNDRFEVFTNARDGYRLLVLNRWGERVFDSEVDNAIAWDGTYQGEELPPDVYAYCVEVFCVNGETFTKTGNLTLVK